MGSTWRCELLGPAKIGGYKVCALTGYPSVALLPVIVGRVFPLSPKGLNLRSDLDPEDVAGWVVCVKSGIMGIGP